MNAARERANILLPWTPPPGVLHRRRMVAEESTADFHLASR